MKRRSFLKKCGGLLVAGLSVFSISEKIAELYSVRIKIGKKHPVVYNTFLLYVNKSLKPIRFKFSKIENEWVHYEQV